MYVPADSRDSAIFPPDVSVSHADLERIESALRDLTSGTNELSLTNFKRDVFSGFLPEKLANVGRSIVRHSFVAYSLSSLAALSNLHECLPINHDLQRSHLLLWRDLPRLGEGTHAT